MNHTLIPVHIPEAELQQQLEELLREPPIPPSETAASSTISIDELPADSGNKKTKTDWLTFWAGIRDGRVMASMGDYYTHFKQLKLDFESGSAAQNSAAQKAINSYHDDFDWSRQNNWLIAGTRIFYHTSVLEGKIIHHYQCREQKLTTECFLTIPVYRGTDITSVVADSIGLKYLRKLFDTSDDAETIIKTLEFISGKNRNAIKVWTAATSGDYTRSNHPERAAGFYYSGGFHVSGNYLIIGYQGRSRGVKVSPR